MIGYVMVGTNDMKRSSAFYDALFSEIGAKRTAETEMFIGWSTGAGAMFCVTVPYDHQAATVGNGVMVALEVASREQVDKVYARAISQGAKDEGKPGDRGSGFYAGYFRDPDGNKLNAFFSGQQAS